MDSQADRHDEGDQAWLRERAEAALGRIDAATPARYRSTIDVPAPISQWASLGFKADGLAIVGRMGRGKTHLAWQAAKLWATACLNESLINGMPTLVAHRATELFDALRPDSPQNPYAVLKAAKAAGLLILDDVAAARPSEWTQERLYELVDERYVQELPLLITADVPPNALAEFVGPRVASRLTEMCTVHVVDGPDFRRAGAR
ncbi:DnaA/Hda family protein [Streptomyces sp. H10-C2]|uniref:DnaA ATPase domain-containing protein n=1 Tax=unclassified Streptomyces TaxID=2593676 RepID=UPI0024B937E7|nr:MULTISPECIES: DnaA/Hda family protein [unclassified Streptomyces]MDJ0342214.1 DnaA/Hda family protein [Streptomyces sp. PH10-H1]MDJ0368728.1 DnaA/Hda family protein [Streptomyces sp. H10-C2]